LVVIYDSLFNFYIFKNILQEIDWIKLNLNIIKSYYSNLNIYPCYDLLSKNFISAIDNENFDLEIFEVESENILKQLKFNNIKKNLTES
jgi:hypothetical protein